MGPNREGTLESRKPPPPRKVESEYSIALESVSGIRDREDGTVSFGMFNSGPFVLSGLIPAFRTLYPKVQVRVVGSNSAQIADAVRTGKLEAGVVALPIDARGLTIGAALWSCEAAYFHIDPAATATPVTVAKLLERPLVLPDAGWAQTDPTRRQLSSRAQRAGLSLVPDIEVETGVAALQVAASGVAGAVASVPVAEALGYTKNLNWVSLDPPLIETFERAGAPRHRCRHLHRRSPDADRLRRAVGRVVRSRDAGVLDVDSEHAALIAIRER